MTPKLQIIFLLVGIVFLSVIIYVIRRKSLSPSYSILWLVLAFFFISIPIFQGFYVFISRNFFGFYTENLIYLVVFAFLLVYMLFLTIKIVRLNDQVKELITTNALLEKKLRDLSSDKKVNEIN